jgi:hypothetical protein
MKNNNSSPSSDKVERTIRIDPASLPLGYRLRQADNMVEIDPDAAALIRRAQNEGGGEAVDQPKA